MDNALARLLEIFSPVGTANAAELPRDPYNPIGYGAPSRLAGGGGGVQPIRGYHGSENTTITQFDRPAYFSTSREYADKFGIGRGGRTYEADISPRNPYYTNNEMFIEGLRSFPERGAELKAKGHDAAILSGSPDSLKPLLLLGGYKQPQIYVLDPSIVSGIK